MLLFNIHLFIKITRLSAESSASEPKQAQNRVVRATLHSACRQSTTASADPPLNVLLLKSRSKKHTNQKLCFIKNFENFIYIYKNTTQATRPFSQLMITYYFRLLFMGGTAPSCMCALLSNEFASRQLHESPEVSAPLVLF